MKFASSQSVLYLGMIILLSACLGRSTPEYVPPEIPECENREIEYRKQVGCDGQIYPHPDSSLYMLPFPVGYTYPTGLTNCSSSFHAAGTGDQYAFDFDMVYGDTFLAMREGVVVKVVESEPDGNNGTAGNYLVVDHRDSTYGLYYHSPPDGVIVEVGDEVEQGDPLGLCGNSGYAGYPHLHTLVTRGGYDWPYEGIPISFRNALPAHVVLKSYGSYKACVY